MLHMGHVLNNTIQDILAARRAWTARKSSGCPAPTTPASPRRDGAKQKEEEKNQDDLGREELSKRVGLEGKARGIIIQQLKKLAARATGRANGSPWTRSSCERAAVSWTLQERPHIAAKRMVNCGSRHADGAFR
jgi:hypothetical protein